MTDKFVTLAHGAGGKQTSELIDRVFKEHFANPDLTADDAAVLSMEKGKIAFTTDGFIVSPYEFAGGNIGNQRHVSGFGKRVPFCERPFLHGRKAFVSLLCFRYRGGLSNG